MLTSTVSSFPEAATEHIYRSFLALETATELHSRLLSPSWGQPVSNSEDFHFPSDTAADSCASGFIRPHLTSKAGRERVCFCLYAYYHPWLCWFQHSSRLQGSELTAFDLDQKQCFCPVILDQLFLTQELIPLLKLMEPLSSEVPYNHKLQVIVWLSLLLLGVLSTCVSVDHTQPGVCRGEEKVMDPLELELQTV
ncbi:hypothetical protein STEG23_007096, partial [Scotinomys teguina]